MKLPLVSLSPELKLCRPETKKKSKLFAVFVLLDCFIFLIEIGTNDPYLDFSMLIWSQLLRISSMSLCLSLLQARFVIVFPLEAPVLLNMNFVSK